MIIDEGLLRAYLDNELPPDLHEEVVRQMQTSPKLKTRLAEIEQQVKQTYQMLDHLSSISAPKPLPQQTDRRSSSLPNRLMIWEAPSLWSGLQSDLRKAWSHLDAPLYPDWRFIMKHGLFTLISTIVFLTIIGFVFYIDIETILPISQPQLSHEAPSAQRQATQPLKQPSAVATAPLNISSTNPPTTTTQFEDDIQLIAYNLSSRIIQWGESLDVTLSWQISPSTSQNYAMFIYLVSLDGELTVAHDQPFPLPQTKLTSDNSFTETTTLMIPNGLSSGLYKVVVGLYNTDTGQRLTVSLNNLDDTVMLAPLMVKEPPLTNYIIHPTDIEVFTNWGNPITETLSAETLESLNLSQALDSHMLTISHIPSEAILRNSAFKFTSKWAAYDAFQQWRTLLHQQIDALPQDGEATFLTPLEGQVDMIAIKFTEPLKPTIYWAVIQKDDTLGILTLEHSANVTYDTLFKALLDQLEGRFSILPGEPLTVEPKKIVQAVVGQNNRGVIPNYEVSVDGYILNIKWAIDEGRTITMTKDGIKRDMFDMLYLIKIEKMAYQTINFEATYNLTNEFGDVGEQPVVWMTYDSTTLDQIVFATFPYEEIYSLASPSKVKGAFYALGADPQYIETGELFDRMNHDRPPINVPTSDLNIQPVLTEYILNTAVISDIAQWGDLVTGTLQSDTIQSLSLSYVVDNYSLAMTHPSTGAVLKSMAFSFASPHQAYQNFMARKNALQQQADWLSQKSETEGEVLTLSYGRMSLFAIKMTTPNEPTVYWGVVQADTVLGILTLEHDSSTNLEPLFRVIFTALQQQFEVALNLLSVPSPFSSVPHPFNQIGSQALEDNDIPSPLLLTADDLPAEATWRDSGPYHLRMANAPLYQPYFEPDSVERYAHGIATIPTKDDGLLVLLNHVYHYQDVQSAQNQWQHMADELTQQASDILTEPTMNSSPYIVAVQLVGGDKTNVYWAVMLQETSLTVLVVDDLTGNSSSQGIQLFTDTIAIVQQKLLGEAN